MPIIFSHDITNPVTSPDIKWSHEVASEMMLEALVKENNIPIERDWLDFIRDLIQGVPELTLKRFVLVPAYRLPPD